MSFKTRSLVCRPARLEPDGAAQAQAKNALLLRAGMQTARLEPEAAAQAQAKYALLLCGLIGTLRGGCASCAAGFSRKHHEPEGASARLVAYVAESHLKHVVRPDAAAGGVDVIVHTWNPEAAVFVDAQYGRHLRISLHQAPEARRPVVCALDRERGSPRPRLSAPAGRSQRNGARHALRLVCHQPRADAPGLAPGRTGG